ncbi:metallophosphoesterase [Leptolyngbya cf. ectocarpi LEGE 11479]|uniref:Metallophosphoesterase n=1 Tax=Leptolyngbya cf. ectocarpi LEGE 11479 TaxID=1828722 RepID=A0A928ZQJ0_LEPEC|nr:metallophosphoesterase [Leptolyngbya ectocarpi]MBE9065443.1 metallophosphoesterase [Leptolyngbya cf. ectocarpi LEGE 11479]
MLKTLKYSAIGLASAVGFLAIWGFIEPRLLNTEIETATIPGLPAVWEGKQIGQISDFQVGLWGDNPGTARKGIARLIEANPAAVLISGDFIYHAMPNPEAEITLAASIVEPLIKAGIPTYAVMGNHDYGMSSKKAPPNMELAAQMEEALETVGVDVLKNETVAMTLPDSEDPLFLVALGSRWANQADVDQALDGISNERPRVVLMHNPDTYEQLPANSAPLAVAGHTHGGQIRVPGLPQWSWLRFTQKDKAYADGWAKGYGAPGNNLYVNPGIGMSIVPIRIFCPPEVTLFTLEG